MRIFFTTPFAGGFFQPYINEIYTVLNKNKATIVTSNDLGDTTLVVNNIAEADVVIAEASHESLRMGHEITLGLLYDKPTLVLSQTKDHTKHLTHKLLRSVQYDTKRTLRKAVKDFVKDAQAHLISPPSKNSQTLESGVDALRLATFSTMRQHALQDEGEFGKLAELIEKNPKKARKQVMETLGELPIEKAWSQLASIYNEDTPDFIFTSAIRFVANILNEHGIKPTDNIVDAFTHGGAVSLLLHQLDYTNLTSLSSSRDMLAHTYRRCADVPEIQVVEASPETFQPASAPKAIVWIDYTTNFALTEKVLQTQLQNLLTALRPDGCLIFDVRTAKGWNAYFLRETVATFATENFQRISANTRDNESQLMHFDRFIRLKQTSGGWGEWHREQMIDRMWTVDQVKGIIDQLANCKLVGIYDDDFSPLSDGQEPGLAYFVLQKQAK